MSVEFTDFSMEVKEALKDAAIKYLHEVGGELVAQAARRTPVDTGELAGAWDYIVNEDELTATVGNSLENAIWNEFGTGEHALEGNGRKGGWKYKDEKGNWHYTTGRMPQRTFHKAFTANKQKFIRRAEEAFKSEVK